MALRKSDIQEATELMQNLSNKLDPSSKSLKQAMEKLCMIFQSQLFNSLLDVQEYYEATLEVGEKSRQAYNDDPLNRPTAQHDDAADHAGKKDKSKKKKKTKSSSKQDLSEQLPPAPVEAHWNPPAVDPPSQRPPPPPVPIAARDEQPAAEVQLPGSEWEYDDIELHRGSTGFGFSIAGGFDAPHGDDDPSIVVSKIVPGGVAELDGRLRFNDVVMSVNGFGVEYVSHDDAVGLLKQSGNTLHLTIRRLRGDALPHPPLEMLAPGPPMGSGGVIEVELVKRPTGGLGFTISGLDEGGVEVTTVLPGGLAEENGQIHPGDKIIQVNDTNIEFSSHDEAVQALKSTGQHVRLVLLKPSMMGDHEFQQYEDPLPPASGGIHHEVNFPPEVPMDKPVKKSKSLGGIFKKSKK